MKVKYRGFKKVTETARQMWLLMANDYNNGVDPNEIVKKYINPRTGKHYTRPHLYWVLKQVAKL